MIESLGSKLSLYNGTPLRPLRYGPATDPSTNIRYWIRSANSIDVAQTENRVSENIAHQAPQRSEGSKFTLPESSGHVAQELVGHGSALRLTAGMTDLVRGRAQDDLWRAVQMIAATNALAWVSINPTYGLWRIYQPPPISYYRNRALDDVLPSSVSSLFTTTRISRLLYRRIFIPRDVIKCPSSPRRPAQAHRTAPSEIARRSGVRNEMAVQSALHLLGAGHRTWAPSA